jgi:hypothetical protein
VVESERHFRDRDRIDSDIAFRVSGYETDMTKRQKRAAEAMAEIIERHFNTLPPKRRKERKRAFDNAVREVKQPS